MPIVDPYKKREIVDPYKAPPTDFSQDKYGPARSTLGVEDYSRIHKHLPEDQEEKFRKWYGDLSAKTGLDPNPDDPRHQYDYRSAFLRGAQPQMADDGTLHLPSEFKTDTHPNRFVKQNGKVIDTKYGYEVDYSQLPTVAKPFVTQPILAAGALSEGLGQFSQSLDEIGQYIGNKLGVENRSGAFGKAADYWFNNAQKLADMSARYGTSAVDRFVGKAVGGAVPGIAEFMLNVPYSMAAGAVEAEKTGESELVGAAKSGVERLLLGKILHAMNPLKRVYRAPAMGGVFATQTAAQGGTPEQIAEAAGTGLLYGSIGQPGTMGPREIVENLRPTRGTEGKFTEFFNEAGKRDIDAPLPEDFYNPKAGELPPLEEILRKPEDIYIPPRIPIRRVEPAIDISPRPEPDLIIDPYKPKAEPVSSTPPGAPPPHLETQAQHRERYTAEERRSINNEMNRIVTEKVGSSDPQKILNYYIEKYPALKTIDIKIKRSQSKKYGNRAVTKFKYNTREREVHSVDIILGTRKASTPSIIRHEIEHLLDALHSGRLNFYKKRPSRLVEIDGEKYRMATFDRFDHENYASDYVHYQAVKKALAEGKSVPPEVLKDYPWLEPVSSKRPEAPGSPAPGAPPKAAPGGVEAGGLRYGAELPKYAAGDLSVNLERIDAPYDIKKIIEDTAERNYANLKQKPVSHAETVATAKAMGADAEQLSKYLDQIGGNRSRLYALRDAMTAQGKRVQELRVRAAESGNPEDMVKYRVAMTKLGAYLDTVNGASSEAGRLLNSLKIMAKGENARNANYKAMLDAFGGREVTEAMMERMAKIDPEDTFAVNKFIRKAHKAKTSDMIVEARLMSLLSNPATQSANISGNVSSFVDRYPMKAAAATLDVARAVATRTPREVFFGEIPADAFGAIHGIREGIRRALFAWGEEMSPEAMSKLDLNIRQAIPSVYLREGKEKIRLGKFQTPITGKLTGKKGIPVPLTGEIVLGGRQARLPGRFLLAFDELFRTINETATGHAEAYRIAAREGLKGKAKAERYAELINEPTKEMLAKMKADGDYRTFTKPLGKMGQAVLNFRNSHFFAKILLPFVKVAANLPKFALERTPLNIPRVAAKIFNKEFKGAEASEEASKALVGTLIAWGVFTAAQEGYVTGAGPTNKNERDTLKRTGWQANSFHIGDTYWSYDRGDPFGMVVGMTANASDLWDEMTEDEQVEVINLITRSVARNITSKTYIKSVGDALDAMFYPEQFGQTFMERQAASLVPAGLGAYSRSQDEIVRRVDSIFDAVKARTLASDEMLPMLDLWGRPLKREAGVAETMTSPFYRSTEKGDFVDKEMARLSMGVGMPTQKIRDVELTPAQHNKYIREAGQMGRKRVEDLIRSSGYREMPEELKKEMIRKRIMDAREAVATRMYYQELRKK